MPAFLASIPRRERRALAVLLALAVAGHLLKAVAASRAGTPAAISLFDPATDGNPAAHLDSVRRQARPLGPKERIDVDRASAEELTRLPGVGAVTARRIVADRQRLGAFGSIEGLRRVSGMGPALLAKLAPHLSFGGVAAEAPGKTLPNTVDVNLASVADLAGLPGIGLKRARSIVAFRDSAGPFRQLDDLRRVHGVSASLIRLLEGRLVVP